MNLLVEEFRNMKEADNMKEAITAYIHQKENLGGETAGEKSNPKV